MTSSLRAAARALACTAVLTLGSTLAVAPAPALAEPPPHAKAYGWRKKNDPTYPGYTGRVWAADYGIVTAGRCNTDAVLTAVGGAVGGIIGAQASQGGTDGERAIAILIGSAVGAIVGNRIGREIDRTDQACIGHALELGRDGKPVVWVNPQTNVSYNLLPLRGDGGSCRNFKLDATRGSKTESVTGRACRTGDGAWQLQ